MGTRRLLAALGVAFGMLGATAAHAGVIAHWTFDEGNPGDTASGAGSVLDASPNAHHGTPSGGPVYDAVPGGGTGLRFDGADDRVRVADDATFVSNSITIEAIVSLDRPLGAGALEQIVFRGDDRGGRDPFYLAAFNPAGETGIRFLIEGSGGAAALFSGAVPVGRLLHVAGTLDDATGDMKLYVDGTQVASTNTPHRPDLPLLGAFDPRVVIGDLDQGSGQHLDGLIDEIRISDEALDPSRFLIASTPVPEPASAALAALGLLLAARRRSR